MRLALIRSEDGIVKKYAAQYASQHPGQKQGLEAGIWIEQMTMAGISGAPCQRFIEPHHTAATSRQPAAVSGAGRRPTSNTNAITLVCRAVDLSGVDSGANNEIVYAVERELKAAPLFDPKSVQPSAQISPVDANGTFTFTISVAPQNPLKLQL